MEPPKVLVQSWFEMMMQKDSEEIRNIGKSNLIKVFGDNETVLKALVKHGIVKEE